MIPIWLALHSLIYPFRYASGTPYTKDDGNDDYDENEMAGVCPPMPFFNGIVKQDRQTAESIILYEDYPSPLFIDLTETDPSKQFTFVTRKNSQTISNQGVVTSASDYQRQQQKRLDKQLPAPLKEKLKQVIEKRIR